MYLPVFVNQKQLQTNLVLLVHPGLELLAGLQLAEHLREGVVAQGGVGGQGGVVADLILIWWLWLWWWWCWWSWRWWWWARRSCSSPKCRSPRLLESNTCRSVQGILTGWSSTWPPVVKTRFVNVQTWLDVFVFHYRHWRSWGLFCQCCFLLGIMTGCVWWS